MCYDQHGGIGPPQRGKHMENAFSHNVLQSSAMPSASKGNKPGRALAMAGLGLASTLALVAALRRR